jgi:hypothetical protein
MKHQADVGTLSSRVIFKPVSIPLQNGLRFFRHPMPALYQRNVTNFSSLGIPSNAEKKFLQKRTNLHQRTKGHLEFCIDFFINGA